MGDFSRISAQLTDVAALVEAMQAELHILRSRGCTNCTCSCAAATPALPTSDTEESDPVESFVLYADLGVVTVPEGYMHKTYLAEFRNRHASEFTFLFGNGLDELLTHEATRILKPWDRVRARIFIQTSDGMTSTAERVAFLDRAGAVYLGTQGLMLLWEQCRDGFPKDQWLTSFEGSTGTLSVPRVCVCSEKDHFDRASIYDKWPKDYLMVCFTDSPSD